MQRAHGAPTPNRKRRRSRAAGVLAALTVSACLTVPFTGAAAQALSATPAPLPLTDIPHCIVRRILAQDGLRRQR